MGNQNGINHGAMGWDGQTLNTVPFINTGTLPWVAVQTFNAFGPDPNYNNPLWGLPFVIPYQGCFFSFNNGDGLTILQRAQMMASKIIETRDIIMSSHPNRPRFDWAMWPSRYALDGTLPSTDPNFGKDRPFYHYLDAVTLTGPSRTRNSVFTANGISGLAANTRAYLGYLKPLLDAAGISGPIMVNPDYEGGVSVPISLPPLVPQTDGAGHIQYDASGNVIYTQASIDAQTAEYNKKLQWHSDLLANEPRVDTELVDGRHTYRQFTAGFVDSISGATFSSSLLYPAPYEGDRTLVNTMQSLSNAIVDWGLYQALQLPIKEVWPNTIVQNWQTYGSHYQHQLHGWRWSEGPHSFNSHFWLDAPVPSIYGISFKDFRGGEPSWALNNYDQALLRFNISDAAYLDHANPDGIGLMEKIWLEYHRNFMSSIDYVNKHYTYHGPKRISFSMSWPSPNGAYGIEYPFNSNIWPPAVAAAGGYIDSTRQGSTLIKDVFDIYKQYNVWLVEIFAEHGSSNNGAGWTQIYDELKNLSGAYPQLP